MTLLPLLSGEPIAWNVEAARELIASLIGHLAYGAVAGFAFVVVDRRHDLDSERAAPSRGTVLRGAAAGLAGGIVLAIILDGEPGRRSISTAMAIDRPLSGAVTLVVAMMAGVGFSVLYPRATSGAGPALVRGMAWGFLMWITIAITVIPLAAGDGLGWGIDDVRAGFQTLPGYLLFVGAVPALLYHWFTEIGEALMSDRPAGGDQEGIGTQGLRAIAGGAVAGLVGGAAFSIVMVRVGDLPGVAAMVSQDSTRVGFVIHLVTSVLIGVGYGLAFVKRSNDLSSALGWGTSYGVFWWMMGSLTLLPVFAGGAPRWSVTAAADAFPALIGHLVYGAFLGVVFFRLEARYDPWWVSRNEAERRRARRAADQLSGSAPVLWVLTVLFALVLPILLAP